MAKLGDRRNALERHKLAFLQHHAGFRYRARLGKVRNKEYDKYYTYTTGLRFGAIYYESEPQLLRRHAPRILLIFASHDITLAIAVGILKEVPTAGRQACCQH